MYPYLSCCEGCSFGFSRPDPPQRTRRNRLVVWAYPVHAVVCWWRPLLKLPCYFGLKIVSKCIVIKAYLHSVSVSAMSSDRPELRCIYTELKWMQKRHRFQMGSCQIWVVVWWFEPTPFFRPPWTIFIVASCAPCLRLGPVNFRSGPTYYVGVGKKYYISLKITGPSLNLRVRGPTLLAATLNTWALS